MELWEVVHFTSENTVEAVPHTWVKNSKCAWPKNPKLVKRFIEHHVNPNPTEFYYCPSRKLGKRIYGKFLKYFHVYFYEINFNLML